MNTLMTLEQTRERNDLLRTRFIGGRMLMTPSVYELPAWFRGRAIYQMTQMTSFMNDEHSEGVFTYGGYCWYWNIGMFAGELSISLQLGGIDL